MSIQFVNEYNMIVYTFIYSLVHVYGQQLQAQVLLSQHTEVAI